MREAVLRTIDAIAWAGSVAGLLYAGVGVADAASHARPSQLLLVALAYAVCGFMAGAGALVAIRGVRWARGKRLEQRYESVAASIWAAIALLVVYGVVWLNRYVLVDYPWFSKTAIAATAALCIVAGLGGLAFVPRISRRFAAAPTEPPAWRVRMVRLFPVVLFMAAALNVKGSRHAFDVPAVADGSLPNVVVLVSDCVRADHVSAYGYPLETTPLFDRVAREGLLFEDAHASASWTLPSVTGLLASTRAGIDVKPGVTGTELDTRTLPEVLKDLGYASYAASNNPHLGGRFGIGSRFDAFDGGTNAWQRALDTTIVGLVRHRFLIDDGTMVDRTIAALDDIPEPFFLYLHVMGGHAPYEHPRSYEPAFDVPHADHPITGPHAEMEITDEQRANLVARYDVMIRYADDQLRRLVEALDARGRLDDTLLIYTADHGEEFGEHGRWTHGRSLHVETVRVPLAVRWPGHVPANARRNDLASLLDLGPSVLGAVSSGDLAAPAEWQGTDLQWTRGAPVLPPRVVISELGPALRALVTPRWKYVVDVTDGSALLFDRRADPDEAHDVAADEPEVLLELAGLLDAELGDGPSALRPSEDDAAPTPALVEQLRALGYVE